jgi:hypothetical protein
MSALSSAFQTISGFCSSRSRPHVFSWRVAGWAMATHSCTAHNAMCEIFKMIAECESSVEPSCETRNAYI